MIVISAAGGPTLKGPMDYLTSFVNAIFGFIGFNDIKHVNINSKLCLIILIQLYKYIFIIN